MIKHFALGACALALLVQPSFAAEAKREAPAKAERPAAKKEQAKKPAKREAMKADEKTIPSKEGPKDQAKKVEPKEEPKKEGARKDEPKKDGLHGLIAQHARANGIPEDLVHRVIKRESRYNPRAVGRGGAMGLMQIKHATARGLGYSGSAAGLLAADTNLTFGVRYLAGAYKVADGDPNRAIAFFARGYYYDAKRKGLHKALAARAARPDLLQEEVVDADVKQTASTAVSLFTAAASPYEGDPK
jgi:soluble lytic murein transglycosylase-like protein